MQHNQRNWLLWLLPTPGNIIFTLLIISGLLWAQNAGAITLGVINAPAVTNTLIPYQGRLTDAGGNPLSNKHAMAFSLYNQAADGDPLWTESRFGLNSVEVVDGLFNVMLGSVDTLEQSVITENSVLYLGITIDTNSEMSPRVQLGAVPYAVQATQALVVPDRSITQEKLKFTTVRPLEYKTCYSCPNTEEIGVGGWLPVKGQDADDILEITISTQGFPILVQMTAGYKTATSMVHYCGIKVFSNGTPKQFVHLEGSRVGTTDYSCSGSWLFDTLPSGTYTFRAMGHMGTTDVTWIHQRQIMAYEFTSTLP